MKFNPLINVKIAKINGIFMIKSLKPIIYPANVKMTTILTSMSRINFMLSRVEQEKVL